MKSLNSSPQRCRDRKECNHVFLLRGQKYINSHEEAFLLSSLSPENKITKSLRTLRLWGKMHFGSGYFGLGYGRSPEKEEGKSGSLRCNTCISPDFSGLYYLFSPILFQELRHVSVVPAAISACWHIVSLTEMLIYELCHLKHRDLALSLKNCL